MDLKTNKKGNKYLLKDINASTLLSTVKKWSNKKYWLLKQFSYNLLGLMV